MMLTRRQMTLWAQLYGLSRKWFGLEPDWHLRQRILDCIRERHRAPVTHSHGLRAHARGIEQ